MQQRSVQRVHEGDRRPARALGAAQRGGEHVVDHQDVGRVVPDRPEDVVSSGQPAVGRSDGIDPGGGQPVVQARRGHRSDPMATVEEALGEAEERVDVPAPGPHAEQEPPGLSVGGGDALVIVVGEAEQRGTAVAGEGGPVHQRERRDVELGQTSDGGPARR